MFNSEALEVATGMVFLYLMMALTCTAIKEWIEGLLKWRAMDLERAIRNMLDDGTGETTQQLYRHPIISSLFQGVYQVERLKTSRFTMGSGADRHMALGARRNLPSYIPTAHFATAFIDHIARGKPPRPPVALAPAPMPSPSSAPTEPPEALTVALLRQRAMAHPTHVRDIVLAAIDYANGDLARVRKQVEHWFDGAMDRASGWYKRRTQALLFVIGIGAAVVLNVDSLNILHRLTSDKTLREAVAQRAEKEPASSGDASSRETLAALKQTRYELDAVPLPIGWEHDDRDGPYALAPTQFCAPDGVADGEVTRRCDLSPHGMYAWLRILAGWLITSMAIMLGAPFWFEVLNRIMIIRSTVKPHEKSPEEPSQDGGDAKTQRLVVSAAPAAAPAPTPAARRPGADGDADAGLPLAS